MKLSDLLRMSITSLFKRKVRTILTVLGVVIGVASIVVMVSLGLGLSKSLMSEYESFGSLTQITVNEGHGQNSQSDESLKLSQEAIESFKQLEHVESVYPVLESNVLAFYGGYMSNLWLRGMPVEALAIEPIEVGEGALPQSSDTELKLFYGSSVLQSFYNAKTGKGFWDTGSLPDIDLYKDPIFIIFDTDAYYNSQGNQNNEKSTNPPKKYLVPACGVEKEPATGYSAYGWNVYCDIDKLEQMLKKIFKNKVIPGQPTTKAGKPYKKIFYNQILVNVDEMDNVTDIQNQINDMGYSAYSNAEWISSNQKTMGYIQAVLGGIGAVSLFVAAIGIANTMMMSIYERTKEIGVMKVLGCDLKDIRRLFLMEAGFIGFIGGVIGLILSFIISGVINKVVSGSEMGYASISYIPFWLVMVSMVFAVFVGMAAGFFPSLRAMRLSALAAIRNE